jgi:hypothetical protein
VSILQRQRFALDVQPSPVAGLRRRGEQAPSGGADGVVEGGGEGRRGGAGAGIGQLGAGVDVDAGGDVGELDHAELRLLLPCPNVLRVLKIQGVDAVLPIYHSLEEAWQARGNASQ